MFQIDIRTIFLAYVVINIVCTFLIALLYLQVKKKFPKSFLILLSFIMSTSGNIFLFFRNSISEGPVIGNALIVSSTVVLLIALEHFINKKGAQIQNYFLILVFLLTESYFFFLRPDMNMRSIILSITYLFLSSQVAWLMLIRTPLRIRIITRGVGIIFCSIFLIHVVHLIFTLLKQEQVTNYFNLDNYEAFFLLSYQVIFIALTYSLSLMYNKRLIVDIKEQEKIVTLLSTEKHQMELNFKNKELFQKELYIASLKEVNKNILTELKKNSDNLTKTKNPDFYKLIKALKNSSQEATIWTEFDHRFKEANSDFYVKLLKNHPTLSSNEVRVSCLLHQNYITKEIAEILKRNFKTIENIRGLIRKKMNLQKGENLTSFLHSIK